MDRHCLCTLPLFVLRTFVEGMGVCLGRCVDCRKGNATVLTRSFGAGRCGARETDNLKVERETDNQGSRECVIIECRERETEISIGGSETFLLFFIFIFDDCETQKTEKSTYGTRKDKDKEIVFVRHREKRMKCGST